MTGVVRPGDVQALGEGHRRFIESWDAEGYRGQIARASKSGQAAGRIAVVTGAARGLGLEIARSFVAEGGVSVLADLLVPRVQAAARPWPASSSSPHRRQGAGREDRRPSTT